MELTLNSFIYFLGEKYEIITNPDLSENFCIRSICLFDGVAADEHTLYLNIGSRPAFGRNILNIVTNGNELSAANHCLCVWQSFLSWRESCRQLALVEHDLSSLLEMGSRWLNSDIMIIDREYRYDGSALPPGAQYDEFFSGTSDLDSDGVEELYRYNPRFDETFLTDGLIYYPHYPMNDHDLYYYNLRYDSLYLGRLLFRTPKDFNRSGLTHLAEGFCRLISKCYEFHYLRKNQGMPRSNVYDIWKLLLENRPVDRDTADRTLVEMGWNSCHRFRILYLKSNGYVSSQETLKFYAAQLEQLFPACIAAQTGEGICVLHDLDVEADEDFRQNLAVFLRENLFVSGISNIFTDFYDSNRYSHQAKEALELGMLKNPSLWRHEFRDYQSDYIFRQCLGKYAARDLCPACLEKLLRHDEENPEVELAKTLEVYYNCKFNAAEAAKQLYIHRTTLFYRLNKIREIAAIDHDDPEIRLQILLCFALLNKEKERRA